MSKVIDNIEDIASIDAKANTSTVNSQVWDYSQMPAGSVLQVQQAIKYDIFASSSTSWVDWTGMTITITPKHPNSKFLISMTSATGNDTSNGFAYVKLKRDATDIALGNARGSETRCWIDCSRQADTSYSVTAKHISGEFLDTPNTSSTITYKLQVIRTVNGVQYWGGSARVDDAQRSSVPSTLTVMEIKQ